MQPPDRVVMAGSSLRSDVLPVLAAGGQAIHASYETTWAHDGVAPELLGDARYHAIANIRALPASLERISRGQRR